MVQLGARSLLITTPHALRAAALPLHHRDPFDRMLIAQAQLENMTLVSELMQCSDSTTIFPFFGRSHKKLHP